MSPDHAFVCGNPALDLAATLRARRTLRCETLVSPERLDAWYLGAGIVDGLSPGCRETDVEQAVRVREAVYALVTARLRGERYDDEALAVVNGAAARPSASPQLTASGRWTEATPAEALAAVARHAVELLGGTEAALLKECGDPECTRVYPDRSRGARRQWCGMEPCGNRVKAAAYRARRKGAPATAAG
ncbi:CGNR zinc finger domain-containing protein [Streptomyces sp. NPDC006622]|uniref:CGNR zinc finger domain-containing protein n=1 Tax=Streptomyces sp. NPDC006622 TaxID=3155459 RepID=UPI0033B8BB11